MAIEIVDFPINSMVIFNSYVKLPEGTSQLWTFYTQQLWSCNSAPMLLWVGEAPVEEILVPAKKDATLQATDGTIVALSQWGAQRYVVTWGNLNDMMTTS